MRMKKKKKMIPIPEVLVRELINPIDIDKVSLELYTGWYPIIGVEYNYKNINIVRKKKETKKKKKCKNYALTRLWCLWIFGILFECRSQFGFGIRLGDALLLFDILRSENNNNNTVVIATVKPATLAGLCNARHFDFRPRSQK